MEAFARRFSFANLPERSRAAPTGPFAAAAIAATIRRKCSRIFFFRPEGVYLRVTKSKSTRHGFLSLFIDQLYPAQHQPFLFVP
jgi:hypothetical protein